MNNPELISFTNANPICFLATSENNQPHVRALGFWFADESGFYFQSGSVKKFVSELKNNPQTEVCFLENKGSIGKMLRIEGEVEFLDDRELRSKALVDRPFLKQFGITEDSPELIIFRISHGSAHFWTMADNLTPKEIIKF
jgi:uncharacterized pyridoxamine 5'-phosphate oxidase family protein